MMKMKVYSKGELAMAYAPDITQQAAVNRLNFWIRRNPKLVEALKEAGYDRFQKLYTVKQVELIFEFLGEP